MSQQSSKTDQPAGIYEALLFLSLTSLIVGCILLSMKLGEYNWILAPTT